MKRIIALILCLAMAFPLCVFSSSTDKMNGESLRETKELYDGVTYTHIKTNSSSLYRAQDFNIVEFDPRQSDLYIDVVGAGKYSNNAKKVQNIVQNFADSQNEKVPLAAINGDLWMTSYAHSRVEGSGTSYGGYDDAVVKKALSVPRGFNIYDGEIISSDYIYEETPYEGEFWAFGVTDDGRVVLGCPQLSITAQNSDKTIDVDGLNRLPADNALVLYSDKGCLNNYALDDAYELLLETDYDYTVKNGAAISAKVIGIYGSDTMDNPSMSDNHFILTARGSAVSRISSCKVGDTLTFNFDISEKYNKNEDVWSKVINCVGGHMPFVVDGVKNEISGNESAYPTTIVGIKNDGNVVFIANDKGIDGQRGGISFNRYWDLADDFDLNTAFLLDGGGSTTMALLDKGEYKVVSHSSDAGGRSVINSVVLSVGEKRKTSESPIKKPSSYLDLADIDFALDSTALLSPATSQFRFTTTSEGGELKVDKYNGDAYAIFSFGMPNTRLSNSNSVIADIEYPIVSLNEYNYMILNMKVNTSDSTGVQFQTLYLTSGNTTGVSASSFVGFNNAVADGNFHSYIIDISKFSGNLNTLRLGVIAANGTSISDGDTITLRSIRFAGDADEANELANEHTHQLHTDVINEPSCINTGLAEIVCSECHKLLDTIELPETSHIPSKEWKVTEAEHPYLEEGKKELLCTVCGEVLKTEVIPVKEYVKPIDVVDSWYESQVEYCVKHGLMTGMSGTEFGVNSTLTRDQFILILARLANVDENAYKGGDIGFGDVPADHWGAWAIKWAHDEEITAGVGNGNFGVGQSLVREQFAVLIYSYMEKVGKDITIDDAARANFRKYEDINNVSSWAVDGVTWAMSKGIIGSMVTERFVFSPKSNVTRAQAAVMIRNIHSDGLFD